MGYPRRYTKQDTFKGLPIARDAERNTACDSVALNSIKTMMDKTTGNEDAKIVRLDVTIPASQTDNDLFRKAQADIMKNYKRHNTPIEYVGYKHEFSDGSSVYKLAILTSGNQQIDEIADRTAEVFNHKLKERGEDAGVAVSVGNVVPFSGANAQSYKDAFLAASDIAQVELSPEKTKVLFSSKG